MQIYFINLDRHEDRRRRMCELLQGLPFERIAAVDGRTVDGPERREPIRPSGYAHLTRYERACILSHRKAWSRFLESGERLACVLEDDVSLSPSFGDFIRDESWFPPDGRIIKLETYDQPVVLSRHAIPCMGRTFATLRSRHLGTAAYVVNRDAAAFYLKETIQPDLPLDYFIFGNSAVKRHSPVYQLSPALSIQAKRFAGGIAFPELASSIESEAPKVRKPFLLKLKNEVRRPLLHLGTFLWSIASGRRFLERRYPRVGFA